MRKYVLPVVLLVLTNFAPLFAQQFEDYEWRKPKAVLSELLNKKGKQVETIDFPYHKEIQLRYKDVIFDESCDVSLAIHNEYGLYVVRLEWGDLFSVKNLQGKLIKTISDKYGEYVFETIDKTETLLIEHYKWTFKERGKQEIEINMAICRDPQEQPLYKDSLTVTYYCSDIINKLEETQEKVNDSKVKNDRRRF